FRPMSSSGPTTTARRPRPSWPYSRNRVSGKPGAVQTSPTAVLQPCLLCAFPDHRRGSAARRGRGRVPQLVTADGERPLLFSPAPIGERGGLDLEGKGLVRRVDGQDAEVGEAPPDDRLLLLRRG